MLLKQEYQYLKHQEKILWYNGEVKVVGTPTKSGDVKKTFEAMDTEARKSAYGRRKAVYMIFKHILTERRTFNNVIQGNLEQVPTP